MGLIEIKNNTWIKIELTELMIVMVIENSFYTGKWTKWNRRKVILYRIL